MQRLAGLALAGGLLLCACGGVGKTVRRADDYMDAGRYTAAARTYTTALEKRPRDPELLVAVARAWLAAEDPARALAPAQLAAAAEAPGGRLAYVAALVGTGEAAKAQPLVESELLDQGESAEAEFLLAEIRLASGDVQGAVSAVESGLPRSQAPRGTAFAAWVHHRRGNQDRAVDLARRAVDHVEADTQVFAEAAAVFLAAGKADEASSAASRARTAMREEDTLWLESAARRQETGDIEGAIRRLSWLGAVRPGDGMVPLQLAELWLERKDPKMARAQLDLARRLKPFSALVAQQGDVQVAEAASASLSESERVSALTRLYLAEAEAWRQVGDAPRSLTARTQALQVQPDGGDLGEWLVVGRSWNELKRFDQAAAAGKVMLTADPRSVPGHLLLLQASAGLGQIDTAIGYGRVAWSLSPADPDIALMMAQLHGARGEDREALKLLEAARQAHPDDPRLGPAIQRLRADP